MRFAMFDVSHRVARTQLFLLIFLREKFLPYLALQCKLLREPENVDDHFTEINLGAYGIQVAS
jgi:hypothetical protein